MRKLLNWLRRSLDHDMSLGYAKQLLWLSALFVLLFLIIMLTLFVIGFVDKAFDMGDVNLPGTAFLLLTDPGNLSGVLPTNQSWIVGIIYAFITIAGAIVFGGLLISLLSNSVQRRIENIQSGNVYYDLKDHIVIIGYDTIVPYLVRQVREKWPDRDVLLLTKKSPVEVREALNTVINGIAEDKHLIIYSGTRSSETDLQKLLPKEAHEIFIIGNRQSDDHDALNIDCLSKLLNIIQPEPEKNEQQEATKEEQEATKEEQEATKEEQEAVKEQKQVEFLMAMPVVNILLENPATQTMLQSTNLADHWQKYLRVIPFSFYETWTRQVLCVQTDDVRQYPRLQVDRKSDEQLNVVIFGMSKMGITMAVEAAHALHFPRKKDGSVCKTIITFVSLDAYEEMTLFRARYRQIFEIQSSRYIDLTGKGKPVVEEMPPTYFKGKDADILDIEFEFVRGNAFSEAVHQFLSDRIEKDHHKLALFACTGKDTTNMNIALYMPEVVLRHANIFIRQHHSGLLIDWLQTRSEEEQGLYANIYPFGMDDVAFDLQHKSQLMGMLINYYYCYRDDKNMQEMFKENHLLTDEEKKKVRATWHSQTAVADQWSSSYCCMSFVPKLAQWGITTLNAANIDAIKKVVSEEIKVLGYIEHNRWNIEKLMLGYRKPHADEQAEIDECRQHIADIEKDKKLKKQCKYRIYKGKHIHDYLRSFDDLATVTWVDMDREKDDVRKIDYDMLQQIPWIINNNDNYEQN